MKANLRAMIYRGVGECWRRLRARAGGRKRRLTGDDGTRQRSYVGVESRSLPQEAVKTREVIGIIATVTRPRGPFLQYKSYRPHARLNQASIAYARTSLVNAFGNV
jgi:hypothetical protein